MGGGLLLGYATTRPRDFLGDRALFDRQGDASALNAWLRIATDGRVTVAVPRAEMGQGVYTALAMLVAEELDLPWSRVEVEQAPIAKVYGNITALVSALPLADDDERWWVRSGRFALERVARVLGVQITGGSTSVRDAWLPMRCAGAAARSMLMAAAAARLGVTVEQLQASDGQVVHAASGRALAYGTLAAEASLLPAPREPGLKRPADYRYLGKPLPRLDLVSKVNGSAQFGIDLTQHELWHAALRIAPVFGGHLKLVDRAALEAAPGVHAVVMSEDAVTVVARSWWQAEQALRATPPQFDDGQHGAVSSATLYADYARALDGDSGVVYEDRGDTLAHLAAGPIIQAEFHVPPLAHACMEPMNCTARVDAGRAEIWCGNQAPDLFRLLAADALDLDPAQVTLHTPLLGGGFGRRIEADVMLRTLQVARTLPGRTIKLVYSREQDIQHDTYRPPVLARCAARLDARGRILAWHQRSASPAVSQAVLGRAFPHLPLAGPDRTNVEGAAWLAYGVPHRRVEHVTCPIPLPVGFWRSVGHSHNAFFSECFMDELAHAAGKDALQFRLDHLATGCREQRVLLALRDAWSQPIADGHARGLAVHECFGSVAAQVAEVSLREGAVRVHKVWCAVDCGQCINPDTVIAQMESGIAFGLSAALYGDADYRDGRIQQQNFFDHRILTMAQMPEIEVLLLASEDAPGGVGEVGTPPIAPAVANAVARLTGKPVRSLPIKL